MPNRNLAEEVAKLEAKLEALGAEHTRTRRGVETANRATAEVSRRVGLLERLGEAFNTLTDKVAETKSRLRTHDEELANHESRISTLESQGASSQRSIVGVWLATLAIVEATVYVGWRVMAGWMNSSGRLDSLPYYDSLFAWLAVGSAVVITLVTIVLSASERKKAATTTLASNETAVSSSPTEVMESVGA